MRLIQKGREPLELRQYRAVPGAAYDGKDFTPVKDAIRGALLRDQIAICCYCMRRISAGAKSSPKRPDGAAIVQMKVEHWQSQVAHPARQLEWTNLLGACLGNEGSPRRTQTCDTYKAERTITLNPQDQGHVETLSCKSDGRLTSTRSDLLEDIDVHLNLNHEILKNGRKAALDVALAPLKSQYPAAQIPLTAIRRRIDALEAPIARRTNDSATGQELPERRLMEHCGVLRLWARHRFGPEL